MDHTAAVQDVAFSPDGRMLATGSNDAAVRLWDVSTQRLMAVLKGHTGTVNGVTFSPDGRTLTSASEDGTLRFWDPDPQRVTARACRLIGRVSRSRWEHLISDLEYRATCP